MRRWHGLRSNQGDTPHGKQSAGGLASSGSTVYIGPVQVSPFRLPQARFGLSGTHAGDLVRAGTARLLAAEQTDGS